MKTGDTIKVYLGNNQYAYGAVVKDWRTQESAMDYIGQDIHFYLHRKHSQSPVLYYATGSEELRNINESKCVLIEKTIYEARFVSDATKINLYGDFKIRNFVEVLT